MLKCQYKTMSYHKLIKVIPDSGSKQGIIARNLADSYATKAKGVSWFRNIYKGADWHLIANTLSH
jgi:hypothetical protein